jgi:hypothetical protein
MPGTSVRKTVINLSTGVHIPCCWDDCTRDGVELHKCVVREPTGRAHYVFCSERHRQFWINSHRDNGRLPAGFRLSVT